MSLVKVSAGTRRVYGSTRSAHKYRRHSPQVNSRARFFGSLYRYQRRRSNGVCASALGYLSDSYLLSTFDRQIDSPQSSAPSRCSESDLEWGFSLDGLDVGASSTDDAACTYDFEGDQYGSMMQLASGRTTESVCALSELRALVSSCSSRRADSLHTQHTVADGSPNR